jgi:hypothetical protein
MQLAPIKKNQALKGKELKGKENSEIGGHNLLILFVMSLLLLCSLLLIVRSNGL